MRGVYDHVPVLQCGGKALEGSRCRPRQDSACDAEVGAVTGTENDVTFRDIVHDTLLVRTFVRQRQDACRLPYQQKTPWPEMGHTPYGKLLERTKSKLSSPLARLCRRRP